GRREDDRPIVEPFRRRRRYLQGSPIQPVGAWPWLAERAYGHHAASLVAQLDLQAAQVTARRAFGANLDEEFFASRNRRGNIPHRQAYSMFAGAERKGQRGLGMRNAVDPL